MSNQEIIDDVICRATIELLQAYGVIAEVAKVVVVPSDFSCAAAVGFTGPAMRGSVLLAMPDDVARRTCPLPSPHAHRAWIGELSNQLLGRIKSKLLGYGVELHMTIPVVLPARLLAPSAGTELVAYRFTSPIGNVLVWFDHEAAPGLELVKQNQSDDNPEGTAIFW